MSTVAFNYIPGNLVAPLISFELNSGGQFENQSRYLAIGHKNAGSPASVLDNVPFRCNSREEAIAYFGKGSMLAEMVIAARLNAPAQDIWVMPVPSTGVAEVRTLTVGSVPAAGGYGVIEIAGWPVAMTIGAGDTASAVATALAAAINAFQDELTKSALPFTATAATNVVTLTARHAGEIFNTVDIRIPPAATASGNVFDGLLTLATTTAGTGTPNVSTGLAALGDDPYDWIASPFGDATNMGRYATLLSDVSGRWSWAQQLYGHVFVPKIDTTGNLTTFGLGYDTRHISTLPRLASGGDATPPWVWVAAQVARITPWLSDGASGNVSRNQTGLRVEGVKAPRDRSAWLRYEARNAFLTTGLSTYQVSNDNQVMIDKIITMQRTDGAGNVDTTFRDIQSIGQCVYALRRFRARLQAEHGNKALADDNPNDLQALTTPKDIRNTMAATYAEMPGVLENVKAFCAALIVVRNADNPNRIDIYAPLDRVNPLDIIAANARIYAQYPASMAA